MVCSRKKNWVLSYCDRKWLVVYVRSLSEIQALTDSPWAHENSWRTSIQFIVCPNYFGSNWKDTNEALVHTCFLFLQAEEKQFSMFTIHSAFMVYRICISSEIKFLDASSHYDAAVEKHRDPLAAACVPLADWVNVNATLSSPSPSTASPVSVGAASAKVKRKNKQRKKWTSTSILT